MHAAKYLCVAALAAASIGAATTASAQSRDDAIHKCIQQARANFPDSGGADDSQDANRSAFYKACMTSAGFTP